MFRNKAAFGLGARVYQNKVVHQPLDNQRTVVHILMGARVGILSQVGSTLTRGFARRVITSKVRKQCRGIRCGGSGRLSIFSRIKVGRIETEDVIIVVCSVSVENHTHGNLGVASCTILALRDIVFNIRLRIENLNQRVGER